MNTGSKYDFCKAMAKELYEKGEGSVPIAEKISSINSEINRDSLARTIRNWASVEGWQGHPSRVNKTTAKVLLFDLETAPLVCYTWGKWGQNIGDDMILQDWFILSWSAKWLFEDKVYSANCTPDEVKEQNDSRIVQSLWQMLNEADVVIAHNLKKFDQKRINTRFFKYGLNLPSPYQTIDTLTHARRKFAIVSNRLDYIASNFLGIAGKMETPKGLWWDCMKGDAEAMKTMVEYCNQDVRVLEDVYLHMRPYIQPHPNIGLIAGATERSCSCCGSTNLVIGGTYNTYVNTFTVLRCNDCGGINRERKNSTEKQVRDNLTVSVPQ